jgi:hypothetical protein
VADIVSDRHPVATQSIRVCLGFGRISATLLEDTRKIEDPCRAFKEGGSGKEPEAMQVS